MVAPATLAELDRAQYIALTTTKRDGTDVRTPVWFAVDGDTIVVVTDRDAGKVKRIRNDAHVRLVRCDARGRSAAGADELAGTAAILDGAEAERADAVLARKYGLTWRAFGLATGLLGTLRRQSAPNRVHLGITLDDPAP
ncbi:MAG: PPOX class F420-dependent oxidoreductase [Acidimicrobiales bacterium]